MSAITNNYHNSHPGTADGNHADITREGPLKIRWYPPAIPKPGVAEQPKTDSSNPYSGDLKSIKSKDGRTTVSLDNGLRAEVTKEGIKFSLRNMKTGQGPAWHSFTIGEIKFSDLEKISAAEPVEYEMDEKTTNAALGLFNALSDTDGLSKMDRVDADGIRDSLAPFLGVSSRGTEIDKAAFRGMEFGKIQGDLNGKIDLDYRTGSNPNNGSDVHLSLEDDLLTFKSTNTIEYVTGWQDGGEHVTDEDGFKFTKIEPVVSSSMQVVDLSDPQSWNASRLNEVVDLKRLLNGVNPDNLTATEKTNFDLISEKVETGLQQRDPHFDQPTVQNISSDKEGEIEIDYIQGKASDPTAAKTAVIKGDEIHISYTEIEPSVWYGGVVTANVDYIDKTEVLNLTDIESWTAKQISLASDLKIALGNTGDVELTGEQQQVVDTLLEKMETVSRPYMTDIQAREPLSGSFSGLPRTSIGYAGYDRTDTDSSEADSVDTDMDTGE